VILVDTSILSRLFRRTKPGPAELALRRVVDTLLASDTPLALPAIVLQEALTGIRDERQFLDLERRLLGAFPIVHPTTRDHVEAARLRNRCQLEGLNVSGVDCLIAAAAISRGWELLARDEDFEHIARHAPLRLHALAR
jgi:hypothetical protein